MPNRPDAYTAKYFVLGFLAAFLVLAVGFLFLISASQTPVSPRAEAVAEMDAAPPPQYQPSEDDALTLVVFGTQRANNVASTFILLRFDPVRGDIGVAVLPPGTVISNEDEGETLAHAFSFGGAIYTRDMLAGFLDIPIDRFARISVANFITAAAAVGSIEFDIAQELTIHDGNLPVTLSAGRHLLDGRQIAALIQYENYPGGEMQRADITAQLVSAAINQRIDIVDSTLADRIFETVINLVDTDITFADFERRRNAARMMSGAGGEIARILTLQGQFSPDGARFILSDTAKASIALMFL